MKNYKTLITVLVLAASATLCAEAEHPQARDYEKALSREDRENIEYVVSTLANESMFSLMFKKSALKRAGNATSHVHPLKFFEYVLTHKQLRIDFGYMSGTPWRRFVEGFEGSFRRSDRRNNMEEEDIRRFSEAVGIEYAKVHNYVVKKQWGEMLHMLRDYSYERWVRR